MTTAAMLVIAKMPYMSAMNCRVRAGGLSELGPAAIAAGGGLASPEEG